MRNGFNQFTVPYMNELTANQYNATSVFGGNMPLGFVQYSMDVINGWFQQPVPRTGKPEDFEEVIINGRRVLRRRRTQADDIFNLPSTGTTSPTTPPIAGGTNPTQQGAIQKCTDANGIIDRLLGRCCPFEVINGKCIMVSDGKDTMPDPYGAGKKVEGMIESVGGLTEISNRTVIILIGLILLIAAIVSLR